MDFLLYIYSAVFLAPFVLGFSPIFRAFSEAGGGKKSSTGTKTLPTRLGPLANGIEKNANDSTIHNNNDAERTKYDQTTIMTSFTRKSNSTEEDVTGFSSPYLCSRVVLNSGHPVQKSKCGACALTGYCSFNLWLLLVIATGGLRNKTLNLSCV